jgi:lipid-A-disaccharide synthase
MTKEEKILFISGEISGDLHGAALIHELRKINSRFSFFGIGGDQMKSEGMHLTEHIDNMAFMGFVEVIRHIPYINKVKKSILELVKKEDIKTAVLIDYPGFNLNLARKLKELDVKIIYYITPQVWAWGKGRIKAIKELINKVLVILPFEKKFFEKYGIEAEYVGHPLIDRISDYSFQKKEEFFGEYNLNLLKPVLLILPGSRRQEVETIFPECIKAANRIIKEFDMQAAVACSENIEEEFFAKYKKDFRFNVIKGKTYELFKYSEAGIIKSGTSTLEAALFELPMVVVYKTNPLTYLIGKNLVSLRNISLVNIIYGKELVPELIQNNLTSERIYNETRKVITDNRNDKGIIKELREVKKIIGGKGASRKTALIIAGITGNV